MQRAKKFGGYTVAGVPRKEKQHRSAQTVMALLLGVFFCGPFALRFLGWHMSIAEIGVAVAIDVLLLLAFALWALRTWDY